ncbi:MAG: Hsp20/alpha crystallin family protein [Hyphomicrobiaceae bacterium]
MASRSWLPALWPEHRDGDPFFAMRKQMDDLFSDWARHVPERTGARESGLLAPRIDVSESDKDIRITAELPGVEEKDVEVTLQGDALIIKGEKRAEKEEKDEKEGRHYHHIERSYGAFERRFALPAEVVTDKVAADFKNGVLTVVMPKSPEASKRSRKIAVRTES